MSEERTEQPLAARLSREVVELRQAVATHLRYLGGVEEGLRQDRRTMTREVAANIVQHQRRNLLRAVERTGKLHDGYADYSFTLPDESEGSD